MAAAVLGRSNEGIDIADGVFQTLETQYLVEAMTVPYCKCWKGRKSGKRCLETCLAVGHEVKGSTS